MQIRTFGLGLVILKTTSLSTARVHFESILLFSFCPHLPLNDDVLKIEKSLRFADSACYAVSAFATSTPLVDEVPSRTMSNSTLLPLFMYRRTPSSDLHNYSMDVKNMCARFWQSVAMIAATAVLHEPAAVGLHHPDIDTADAITSTRLTCIRLWY
ncbi:uncharacterized protein CC84DRAFT_156111 [Paraphaeosphaeria sporulosa]|uniref:Uncharacterized protein n=1 Tax=Paraphaeosphaeria sporulosa TaxID=1460663 RepID=A0A177CYS6_9PLEO|nr:uncharacterized protein CC84DRAFT_156111 [Paraphaeosphaeria sporulosa]OAG12704.1 hypothetical protein CC84DRAFT_156111 [Paraphaeosphaeria sporulosa]